MGCLTCDDHQPEEVEAYGDIAGIGVILSFLLSASSLVIYIFTYYLAVYNPDLDPFRPLNKPHQLAEIPNPVDRTFLRLVRRAYATILSKAHLKKMTPSSSAEHQAFEKAMMKCARLVSDIQIFTSLAVLVSGFKEFRCDLQSYHWQIILYMAWLASTSHMAVLSSLRNYLLTHRKQLWWRFGGMFVIAVMLLVALALTSTLSSAYAIDLFQLGGKRAVSNLGEGVSRLAKCTAPETDAKDTLESKVKIGIFLGYGYGIRVLKLFKGFDNTPRRLSLWLRTRSIRIQDGHGESPRWDPHDRDVSRMQRAANILLKPLLVALLRMLHIHLDLLTSFLAEVFWLIVSFTWAAMRLIRLRHAVNLSEENEWTFGQIFSVVLLIAPMVAFISSFSPSKPSISALANNADQTNDRSQPQTQSVTRASDVLTIDQKVNEEYESSASFRGASILAGFTYLNIATFILSSDRTSPSIDYIVGAQLWSSAFLQPLYQTSWPLYCLWVPQLALSKTRTFAILDSIFLMVFVLMTSMPSYQSSFELADQTIPEWQSDPHALIKSDIWGVISLIIAYFTFLGWFVLDSRVRLMGSAQPYWLKSLYLFLVSLGSIICLGIALIPFFISTFLGIKRHATRTIEKCYLHHSGPCPDFSGPAQARARYQYKQIQGTQHRTAASKGQFTRYRIHTERLIPGCSEQPRSIEVGQSVEIYCFHPIEAF